MNDLRKKRDLDFLREKFIADLDLSRLKSICRSKLRGKEKTLVKVGDGSDFSVWLLEQEKKTPLAIHMSHKSKETEACRLKQLKWQKAVAKLQCLYLPLIPPVQVFSVEEKIFMVSPYGKEDQSQVAPQWCPLEHEISGLKKNLFRHKLQINDHLQIRTYKGIPFVCDLSDLVEIT